MNLRIFKKMKAFLEQFYLGGRVAVVTGASEGIGHDLALGLAKAGSDLVLCSRREEKLCELKNEIESLGQQAEIFVLDVCNLKKIQDLRGFVLDRFGKVDVLVNSAGYKVRKMAWDTDEKDWDAMVDTGLKGLYFCCQAIGSIMRDHQYGKIVNLSSTFSRSSAMGQSVYGTVKAGVSRLTELLAMEWAKDGIRVNAIAPTAIFTPSRQNTLKGDILKTVLGRIPLGRLGTTDDLIGAAIYLASAASDFVTGHTLFVDGGWVAAS